MAENRSFYLCVERVESEGAHVAELPLSARDMDGWNENVTGWSIGTESSGAFIKINEPALENGSLGIFPASNYVILWGQVPSGHDSLPIIGYAHDFDANSLAESADQRARQRNYHVFYCRFDTVPLRIGDHVVSFSYDKPRLGL